jgi:hypothetical protein
LGEEQGAVAYMQAASAVLPSPSPPTNDDTLHSHCQHFSSKAGASLAVLALFEVNHLESGAAAHRRRRRRAAIHSLLFPSLTGFGPFPFFLALFFALPHLSFL